MSSSTDLILLNGSIKSSVFVNKFIDYSFDYLKPNGYLLFITPTSWMNGTVTCWSKMISNQIHYLNINECKRHFPNVGSTFSYYLIEHCDIYKDTDVVSKYKKKLYKSTIRLSKDIQIIPQLLTNESLSIINKKRYLDFFQNIEQETNPTSMARITKENQ